jgi:TonB family protein
MCRSLNIACKSISILLVLTGGAVAQSHPESAPQQQRVLVLRPPNREIPAASLDCTPEEAKWWNDLRNAGKAVQEKRGRKERDKFLDLLAQGKDKSYQPPIPDNRVIVLSKIEPSYTEQARQRKINGTIKMAVTIRPDGYIGEVEILQGLGYGLDEKAAEAARLTTFVPPVKNRQFTSYRLLMEMSFSSY